MNITVAPRAGAWIETDVTINECIAIGSLPARERGLKLRRIQAENGTLANFRGIM